MATKTYCDVCGDEGAVSPYRFDGQTYDLDDKCRLEVEALGGAWRDEKLKTKKQSVVVDAAVAAELSKP